MSGGKKKSPPQVAAYKSHGNIGGIVDHSLGSLAAILDSRIADPSRLRELPLPLSLSLPFCLAPRLACENGDSRSTRSFRLVLSRFGIRWIREIRRQAKKADPFSFFFFSSLFFQKDSGSHCSRLRFILSCVRTLCRGEGHFRSFNYFRIDRRSKQSSHAALNIIALLQPIADRGLRISLLATGAK